MKTLIIGDIAGQLDCLLRLIKNAPPHDRVLCVGDLIDRGPRSKQVLDYIMSTPNISSLKGNHEHMFEDHVFTFGIPKGIYASGVWESNGGIQTLLSFFPGDSVNQSTYLDTLRPYAAYCRELPYRYDEPGLIVTHAPINPLVKEDGFSEFWFRGDPQEIEGTIQIYGHNPGQEVKEHRNTFNRLYALGIDTSWGKKLTGVVWPDMTFIQEPYEWAD